MSTSISVKRFQWQVKRFCHLLKFRLLPDLQLMQGDNRFFVEQVYYRLPLDVFQYVLEFIPIVIPSRRRYAGAVEFVPLADYFANFDAIMTQGRHYTMTAVYDLNLFASPIRQRSFEIYIV